MLQRALYVLGQSMVMKMNDDCWRAILISGIANGSIQYDAAGTANRVSKGVLDALIVKMRRATGSNPGAVDGFKLTRIYMSPEARSSLMYLTNADLDDQTRREIITDDEGKVVGFFGLSFYDMVQFGLASETTATFEQYFEANGGILPGSKTQIMVGIDAGKKDRLVLPVVEQPTVHEDPQAMRRNEVSMYLRAEYGAAVLDPRLIRLAAI